MADRPPALHTHAMDELHFIRATMARAGAFTAVPGWGGVWMGTSALAAAAISGPPTRATSWIAVWLVDAAAAAGIAVVAIARKAQKSGAPVTAIPTRRFVLALAPPLVAGAVLTAVLVRAGLSAQLPGCWLLLYGVALASGGAFSVSIVPVMGMLFMTLGILAFAAPAGWGHYFMAAGFGVLHIVFGLVIVRKYGG